MAITYSRYVEEGLALGVFCSIYGLYLFKKVWDHDLILPGTLTIYIPKWIFIITGLLLQVPLPAAW